jgi:hypothetical protein
MDYDIPNVSAETVIEAVEGIYYSKNKGMSRKEVAKYIGKSEEYARRALIVGTQLNFIKERNKKYFIHECADLIRADKEQRRIIFRRHLQKYDPFVLFLTLIGRGNDIQAAIRKIKVIYKIPSSEKDIRAAFLNWGQFSGIFSYDKEKNTTVLKVDVGGLSLKYLKSLIESLDHEIKTKIYIADKLSENVFGYLKHDEMEFFIKALRNHEKDPRNAIEDAGRAFEDFLRRIATENDIDVSNLNGISEIAQMIGRKKTGLIHSKHLNICLGLGAIRAIAAHSKDKKTLEKWEVNSDLALEAILMMLSTIRSIYLYVKENRQELYVGWLWSKKRKLVERGENELQNIPYLQKI